MIAVKLITDESWVSGQIKATPATITARLFLFSFSPPINTVTVASYCITPLLFNHLLHFNSQLLYSTIEKWLSPEPKLSSLSLSTTPIPLTRQNYPPSPVRPLSLDQPGISASSNPRQLLNLDLLLLPVSLLLYPMFSRKRSSKPVRISCVCVFSYSFYLLAFPISSSLFFSAMAVRSICNTEGHEK